MNIQPGDVVRISHEALLPNYLLGRKAEVIFSVTPLDGYDFAVAVRLGYGSRDFRVRKVKVWKEEVERICCM